MKKCIKKIPLAVIIAGMVMMMAGCAGMNQGGYPMLGTIAPVVSSSGSSMGPLVAVGPIDVPGYIERASTIMETTVNMANVSSIDQRVYVLKREIPRVITENLRVLFAPAGIAVVPYTHGSVSDYRVAIDLTVFDIAGSGLIETKARWALYSKRVSAPVLVRDISFNTPVERRDDAGVNAAMSEALANLSRSIAQGARPVLEGK